ncbi:hypothetical protein GALL_472060 [mine drainage metagenome]|uniref:Uncharacterized protein n=1 Tax=mine drainage metagenome TaxID=410659 RepID=A0A1J5PJ06_9ZZZZ
MGDVGRDLSQRLCRRLLARGHTVDMGADQRKIVVAGRALNAGREVARGQALQGVGDALHPQFAAVSKPKAAAKRDGEGGKQAKDQHIEEHVPKRDHRLAVLGDDKLAAEEIPGKAKVIARAAMGIGAKVELQETFGATHQGGVAIDLPIRGKVGQHALRWIGDGALIGDDGGKRSRGGRCGEACHLLFQIGAHPGVKRVADHKVGAAKAGKTDKGEQRHEEDREAHGGRAQKGAGPAHHASIR